MSKCGDLVSSLLAQKGVTPPKQDVESLIKYFEAEMKSRPVFGPEGMQLAFDVAYNKMQDLKLAARQAKREALINVVKRQNALAKVDEYTSGDLKKLFRNKTETQREIEAYKAQLVGTSQFVKGARDSVANRTAGLEKELLGSILRNLNAKGEQFEDILRRGSLDEEIYRYAYDRDADGVSNEAKIIHEVIAKHQSAQRERKNQAGSFIGSREDFLVRQQHDAQLIRKTPKSEYINDLKEMLNLDESLKGRPTPEEQDEYFDELYNRFSTGKHHLIESEEGGLVGSPSTFNIAKNVSQARTLHFKDGESAFRYAQKYTDTGIWDKLADSARNDARTISMMEMFGPNPIAMHKTIMRDLEVRAQARGEVITGLEKSMIESYFNTVDGSLDVPGDITLARIGFGSRVLENTSKLGGAVISAFGDPVFKGATLNRRTDMGFFGSYVKAVTDLIARVPEADKKHVAEMIPVYVEGVLSNSFTRTGAAETAMPGRMARLQELFFRWSGLQWWTINHKQGLMHSFSFDLARYRNVKFQDLPENTRRNLELYNISEEEWNLTEFMETLVPESGNHFITPGAARSLPDEVVDRVISQRLDTLAVTPEMRNAFRTELSTKLQTMFQDVADEGVVTPGARERAIMTLGTQKGTYLGEFIRSIGQFKSFPITVISKQLVPTYYAAGGGARGFAALMPIIIATTALGYASGAAKDILKGREPKDPRNPAAWKDALVRGGGMGILGDFMFAEYSRYGRSLTETLAGPSIGTLSDAASLAHRSYTFQAEPEDYFKFVKSITPGANLFYLESAVNYMFFYGLMEHHDPGYLRRMQNNRKRDYEQEFWLEPTSSAVRF